jgi:hypothetical protein
VRDRKNRTSRSFTGLGASVPKGVRDFVESNLATLTEWWDRKYPKNPVRSPEEAPEAKPEKPKRKQRKT